MTDTKKAACGIIFLNVVTLVASKMPRYLPFIMSNFVLAPKSSKLKLNQIHSESLKH